MLEPNILVCLWDAVEKIQVLHLRVLLLFKENLRWWKIRVHHISAMKKLKQLNYLEKQINSFNLSKECGFTWLKSLDCLKILILLFFHDENAWVMARSGSCSCSPWGERTAGDLKTSTISLIHCLTLCLDGLAYLLLFDILCQSVTLYLLNLPVYDSLR